MVAIPPCVPISILIRDRKYLSGLLVSPSWEASRRERFLCLAGLVTTWELSLHKRQVSRNLKDDFNDGEDGPQMKSESQVEPAITLKFVRG